MIRASQSTKNSLNGLAEIILNEASSTQGLEVNRSKSWGGHPIIKCSREKGTRVVKYVITNKGIKGPNPKDYDDGKTRLGAVVQNVTEALSLEGYNYNGRRKMYIPTEEPVLF